MIQLNPTGSKILKIIHIILSSMWVGGAICLTLVLFCITPDGDGVYTWSLALKIIDDFAIIPGAVGCLLVGVVYGIFTKWGFFRHAWLIVKWVLTVAQILFGTFVLGPLVNGNVKIAAATGAAALTDPVFIHNVGTSKILGPIQLAGLLFVVAISILKPWKKKQGVNK